MTAPRTLWLDPGFGASGDMMLGTLIGLGAPVDAVRDGLQSLDVEGWTISTKTVLRCSLASTRAVVDSTEGHHHRTWSSIDAMLAASRLPDAVKAGSRATFRRLGEVEAGIHDVSIDEVHFHEVGAVDAIVDIVGSWLALDALDVAEVRCGPVGIGHGTTEAAHGRLPIPAPATAALLVGAAVTPMDVETETVTPTGAALLVTMAGHWGPLPPGLMIGLARGAGKRDPEHYPNVLTGLLLEANLDTAETSTGQPDDGVSTEHAIVLSTNLDDLSPELIANTVNRCLEAGAADAWTTPIVMKKGRPAVEFHVLCKPAEARMFVTMLYAETGTLGVRSSVVEKHVLARRFVSVQVRGQTISMKVGPYGAKPEFEDLAALGRALDVPVRVLSAEAMAAYRALQSEPNSSGQLANEQISGQTLTS